MPIFGGKQIAELQRRLAIGEQQYQEARGEIARLSEVAANSRLRRLVRQTSRHLLMPMAVRRHGKQIRPLTMRARRSNRFAPNAQNKNRESVLIWSDL